MFINFTRNLLKRLKILIYAYFLKRFPTPFHFSFIYHIKILKKYWVMSLLFSKNAGADGIPHQHWMSVPFSLQPHQQWLFLFYMMCANLHLTWFFIVLTCISVMSRDVEHFFMCLLMIWISSWGSFCSSLFMSWLN